MAKLMKELKLKDDTITKAYLIIEAQQQQIKQLQQQSQSTSCRSSIKTRSKSFNELSDYKNELNNILTYDTLFETLLTNQIKEQQILVNRNKILDLEKEFQFWQDERAKLIQQLEKAATLHSFMEQQNQDLQQLVDQLKLENRVAKQIITQLIQRETNPFSLIDLLSQLQIEALNESFQTFSGFITEIVKYSTSQMRRKKIEDDYQVLELKSQNKQLQQQQIQHEIFVQEMVKILDIENYTNSVQLLTNMKQLKHKQLITQDKENNMNYNNYNLKLQNLVNQYNLLINQIQEKHQDILITQLCFVVKSLLPEIQGASLKLLNGLNSSYRLMRQQVIDT